MTVRFEELVIKRGVTRRRPLRRQRQRRSLSLQREQNSTDVTSLRTITRNGCSHDITRTIRGTITGELWATVMGVTLTSPSR